MKQPKIIIYIINGSSHTLVRYKRECRECAPAAQFVFNHPKCCHELGHVLREFHRFSLSSKHGCMCLSKLQ